MPCLSNPDHENAAQHLARRQALSSERLAELGLKATASLQEQAAALGRLQVRGKSFKANARRFCQRTIGKRVAEIQQVAANIASISITRLSEQTDEIRLGAIADRDWSAARACIETVAKLNGKWPMAGLTAEARLEQAKEAKQGKEGEAVVTRFTLSIFDDRDAAAA